MSVRMGRKLAEMGAQVIGAPLFATGASASRPARRPAATRWRWRSTSRRRACRRATPSSCTSTASPSTILSAALRLMQISHVETQKMLYDA